MCSIEVGPAQPVRIVLCEDSEIVRRRLVAMLGESGHVNLVGCAGDVSSSLELFRGVRPDAVILDVSMPGGSGIDVLEEIRRHDETCVVIVLTNHAVVEMERCCLDAGANFFFSKATEFERVLEVVDEMSRGNCSHLPASLPRAASY